MWLHFYQLNLICFPISVHMILGINEDIKSFSQSHRCYFLSFSPPLPSPPPKMLHIKVYLLSQVLWFIWGLFFCLNCRSFLSYYFSNLPRTRQSYVVPSECLVLPLVNKPDPWWKSAFYSVGTNLGWPEPAFLSRVPVSLKHVQRHQMTKKIFLNSNSE